MHTQPKPLPMHQGKENQLTVETITPDVARRYLLLSVGNRALRPAFVAELAAAMIHGKFQFNGEPIGFDCDGGLVNGHHRLNACVLADAPFITTVVRDLEAGATATIDIGLVRSVSDRLRMDGKHQCHNSVAAVAMAARILTGLAVQIRSIDQFELWKSIVADGHAFVMKNIINVRFMRNGPVTGAFAVAHKADPEKVAAFAFKVRDGVGLTRGSPALVLREFLMLNIGQSRSKRGDRLYRHTTMDISSKVFSAIHADITNQTKTKLTTNAEAVAFFRSFYSRGAAAAAIKEARSLRNEAKIIANKVEAATAGEEDAA